MLSSWLGSATQDTMLKVLRPMIKRGWVNKKKDGAAAEEYANFECRTHILATFPKIGCQKELDCLSVHIILPNKSYSSAAYESSSSALSWTKDEWHGSRRHYNPYNNLRWHCRRGTTNWNFTATNPPFLYRRRRRAHQDSLSVSMELLLQQELGWKKGHPCNKSYIYSQHPVKRMTI